MVDQSSPDTTTLLPCPFCGEANAELEFGPEHRHWPAVRCNECGTLGPSIKLDHNEATALWNTRAPSQCSAGTEQPLNFFSENVDAWGAAEWFNRLAKAIREHDVAVRAGDDVVMEICRNVAASSAMRLVRDYEPQVRAALTRDPAQASAVSDEVLLRCAACGTLNSFEPSDVAQGPLQNRDDTLRGLAEFFSESVHLVWSNDEIAHCLTEMIGQGSQLPSTDRGGK